MVCSAVCDARTSGRLDSRTLVPLLGFGTQLKKSCIKKASNVQIFGLSLATIVMECVVRKATAHEGVVEICADAAKYGELVFQIPQKICDWMPKQKFTCVIAEPEEDNRTAGHLVLCGEVINRQENVTMLSFGGLLMR